MQTAATPIIPSAKSIPYLGIALDMRIDCLRYFVKLSHEYGSVFRVTLLGHPIITRAGLDNNRFRANEGDEYRDVGSAARHSGSEHKHGGSISRRCGAICAPLWRYVERTLAFAFVHTGWGGGAGAAGAEVSWGARR